MGSSCYLGVVLGCVWGRVRDTSIEILGSGLGLGGRGVCVGPLMLGLCFCGVLLVVLLWCCVVVVVLLS